MPRPTETSRDEIVDRLARLFREAGFEGVSLSEISRATGLGRSSLYHWFPGGKAEMALAVIRRSGDWAARHIVAPLRADGTRRERIEAMLTAVDETYAGGETPCVAASLLVGCPEGPLAEALAGFIGDWRAAIATALRETGAAPTEAERLATDALSRIQGGLVLSRALHDPTPFRQALDAVRHSLIPRA